MIENSEKNQHLKPNISVLIVSYNAAHLISNCLDSVLAQKGVSFEILVVDNASTDSSLSLLNTYTSSIHLIASQSNLGFGKANNLAAKNAKGKYLYLLNPDAYLKETNALYNLYRMMEETLETGLCGTPLVNDKNHNEGEPKYRYPDEQHLQRPFADLPGNIAWVIGASMFVRREVYDTVRGFDEDFFLYGEEIDLCCRIRQAGFHIGYCPEVSVFHLGGGSEHQTDHYTLTLKKQNGLHLFYRKHYHPEDVKRLLRKNCRRAAFRMFFNGILHTATGQKKYLHKKMCYQAIYKSSKA